MNYPKLYDNLIERAKHRDLSGYCERHHIVPRSMGGDNNKNNIVELTAREHFLAHWILWKIHRNKQTAHAFFAMTRKNGQQGRGDITAKQYEIAKRAMAESKMGENNHWFGTHGPMYGKNHTEEFKANHRIIMREASAHKKGKPRDDIPGLNSGKGVATQFGNKPAWNIGMSGPASHLWGKNLPEATRQKMRKPKVKLSCLGCRKVFGLNGFNRWNHYEKCKG